MANETRGELAEAIAIVALEKAMKAAGLAGTVFWEVPPAHILVTPDITVGISADNPSHLILVTACDTPRSSAMKYWRNIGEICDAKSGLPTPPQVISLVFRSFVKEELLRLEESLCDAMHLVDRHPDHGQAITDWLEAHHATAPSKKDQKLELVRRHLDKRSQSYDGAFARGIKSLALEVARLLRSHKRTLNPLWALMRDDTSRYRSQPPRTARVTLFRRGMARWLVLDDSLRDLMFERHLKGRLISKNEAPQYAVALGMTRPRIGGFVIGGTGDGRGDMLATVGEDLRTGADFFMKASSGDVIAALRGFRATMAEAPDYMRSVAAQLRTLPGVVAGWHQLCIAEWRRLLTSKGMYELLMECHGDETMGGKVPAAHLERVWIYDHSIAILRAATGRYNDFGYGPLGLAFQKAADNKELKGLFAHVMSGLSGREKVGAAKWIATTLRRSSEPGRRGFQDWLARSRPVSRIIVAAYAFALTQCLREVKAPESLSLEELVAAHTYSLWNKLLTYPDYEGLPGLIVTTCGDFVTRTTVPTLMAEIAGTTVQDAGALSVLKFKGGLVFWTSATDAGRAHKTKELCAKARCLRYQYNKGTYVRRAAASELLLVVDGTFDDADLAALKDAGWNAVFYPDEMTALRARVLRVQ